MAEGSVIRLAARSAGMAEGLAAELDLIADQLCVTVDQDFSHSVVTDSSAPSLQKLVLLINFTLENARAALAAENERRRELAIELESRRALETALRLTAEQARVADRVKSVFLATMHHELRTPMNGVLGMAEIVREMCAGPETAEIAEFARHLEGSARRLHDLIEQMLQFGRLETGGIELREETVTAAAIVAGAIAGVSTDASARRLRLVVEPRGLPQALRVDPAMIRRALAALVSNAVKFGTAPGRIEIAGGTTPEGYAIRVRNQGPGMEAHEIERACQPFQQLEDGTTRGADGAGLGLSVAMQLVRLHGGQLTFSKPEPGWFEVALVLPAERLGGG